MNPISAIIESRSKFENWLDKDVQDKARKEIMELGIPGLVDIRYSEGPSSIRITPVFETEKDYVWYHLKYGNSL